MAVIDLTLDSLKFPGLENYTPPFGTKKSDNVGLTTLEGCNNIAKPWQDQRPIVISENSTCSGDIERNGLIEIDTASITLILTDATFKGCELKIMTTFENGISTIVVGSINYTLNAKSIYKLVFDGSNWIFDNFKKTVFATSRWLIFNFADNNHKSLVVKAGTQMPVADSMVSFMSDTVIDFSAETLQAGKDYYVFVNVNKEFQCSLSKTPSTGYAYIGQFHTLCADAGANLTATIPADPGSLAVNDYTLVKNVPEDSDFFDFYNRKVTAVVSNAIYDTVTVEHALKGFTAGQILPESIWCLTFRPNCKADGMVYDPETDTAVDIYLQSGKGRNTKSVYGGTTIRSRQQENHQADMRAVGKLLISDSEFSSAALGSNEKTAIYGAAESSIVTTGGHVDTASRRMVSFIGVEDMCGSVWQWLRDVSANGGQNFTTYDGVGNLGQTFGTSYALLAGGHWGNGASCGSRCRYANSTRSSAGANLGGRGVSRVVRGV